MEKENYIGTSRPLGEYNKNMLEILRSNLEYFNAKRRKGILTVRHYVAGGDWWELQKDGTTLINYATLSEISYAVLAIANYTRR